MSAATWLDDYFRKAITSIQYLGSLLPNRPAIDFEGAGVTAADDPTNNRTVVTIAGGGSPGGVLAPYAFLAAGGTLLLTQTANAVICDTQGAACTVNIPRSPSDGDRFTIKNAPGDVTNAQTINGYDPTPSIIGTAIMLEDPNNPGSYGIGPFLFSARGGSQGWRWSAALADYEGGEETGAPVSHEEMPGLWVLE